MVRSRQCITHVPGEETKVCEGYKGHDEVEVKSCTLDTCLSGETMVNDETDKANEAGVEDNLFLSRYSRAVTLNGERINMEGETNGYGTWRLTKEQLMEIVPTKIAASNSITDNLISNVNVSLVYNSS